MLKPADRTRVRTATLAGISAAAICGMALVAAPAQATTVYQDPVLSTGIEIGPSGSTTCHVISQAANQPTDPIGLGDNDAKSVTLSGTTLMEPTLGAGTSITAKSTLKLTTKTTTMMFDLNLDLSHFGREKRAREETQREGEGENG